MSLHLEVICGLQVSMDERETQTVRVIGELIPFVLAKYIAGSAAASATDGGAVSDQGAASERAAATGSRRHFGIRRFEIQ